MPNKNLSEEAQWFLRNLQKFQDDFAESVGGQIVTTDKGGGFSNQDERCSTGLPANNGY